MNTTTAELEAARSARDEGTQAAEDHADMRVVAMVNAAIEDAISSGRPFSANDLRAKFPACSRGLVGARIRGYATRRVDGHPLMARVGQEISTDEATHAKPINRYLGWDAYTALNPGAAARYL